MTTSIREFPALFTTLLALAMAGSAQAAPEDYEWTSTTGFLSSAHKEAIETITGQPAFLVDTPVGPRWIVPGNMSGRFTYDPSQVISTQVRGHALAYKGPNIGWTSELQNAFGVVGTYSADTGEVIAANGDGAPGGPDDLVNVHGCGIPCGDGAVDFTIGPWRATGSSVVWIGEGFKEDQTLPQVLPPGDAGAPLGLFSFFNELTGENINIATIDVDFRRAVTEVDIDIKPGDGKGCFNINGHGVIPVAILGANGFDVTTVDASSLSFGGLQVRVRGNNNPQCSIDYANADEYLDMVCQFDDDSNAWVAGNDIASLSGQLLDGSRFEGSDSICLVP